MANIANLSTDRLIELADAGHPLAQQHIAQMQVMARFASAWRGGVSEDGQKFLDYKRKDKYANGQS